MKTIIKWVVISFLSTLLFGCGGGGGSSSSGGGSGGVVYSGPLTVSANGATETGIVTITIDQGVVTVTDGDVVGSAPLSADGSRFSVPIDIYDLEITCSQPIIFSGTVNGNNIEGTVSGSATCRLGSGLSGVVNTSGSFSATATSTGRATKHSATRSAVQKNL